MGFREEYGAMAESFLNIAVDKYMSDEKVKAKIMEYVEKELPKLRKMIKADIIDLIDGEDDIKSEKK